MLNTVCLIVLIIRLLQAFVSSLIKCDKLPEYHCAHFAVDTNKNFGK